MLILFIQHIKSNIQQNPILFHAKLWKSIFTFFADTKNVSKNYLFF